MNITIFARHLKSLLVLLGLVLLNQSVFAQTPTQVVSGLFHTCTLDDIGVYCWGDNSYGQISVPQLSHPTTISANYLYTCAIDDNGLHCWGDKPVGQTNVSLVNPRAVSAGVGHACALDDNGVHCWGNFDSGETIVPSLSHPIAVSAGGAHTCAIDDNGLHCWGNNFEGQTDVPTLSHPTVVTTGLGHTCAIDDNGVHCWGAGTTTTNGINKNNEYGQSIVPNLSHPTQISAGFSHTCALDDNGVHCWGAGLPGVFAHGHYGQSAVPMLNHPTAIGTGSYHSCAIDDDGVHCWGDNQGGQITHSHVSTHHIFGNSTRALFGSSVSYVGDVNNDDYGDYIVGAPFNDVVSTTTLTDAGTASLISGKTNQPLFIFNGTIGKENFGSVVAGVGDLDGDGTPDVAVGAYKDNAVINNITIKGAGSVSVYSGIDGHLIYKKYGDQTNEYYGYSVAGLHDVDGDGHADIAVGAYLADQYIKGSSTLKDIGKVDVLVGTTGNVYRTYWGEQTGDGFGFSVAYAGDINADTFGDLIVGAPFANSVGLKKTGAAYVYSPRADVLLKTLYGINNNSQFGYSTSYAGDINHDGVDDIIIGAPKYDGSAIYGKVTVSGATKDSGAATVYSGATWIALYSFTENATKDYFGTSVISVGDINHDSYDDVAVSSPGFDAPISDSIKSLTDAGKITVYSGATGSVLFSKNGESAKDNFGWSMSAGNIDLYMIDDIVVGSPRADVAGATTSKDAGKISIVSGMLP